MWPGSSPIFAQSLSMARVEVAPVVGRFRLRHASSLSNLSYSPVVTRLSLRACLAASRSRAGIAEPMQDPMASATRWGRGCPCRTWRARPWALPRAPPKGEAFAAPVLALRPRLRAGQPAPGRAWRARTRHADRPCRPRASRPQRRRRRAVAAQARENLGKAKRINLLYRDARTELVEKSHSTFAEKAAGTLFSRPIFSAKDFASIEGGLSRKPLAAFWGHWRKWVSWRSFSLIAVSGP